MELHLRGNIQREKATSGHLTGEKVLGFSTVILPSVSYGFLIFVLICFILFWCFVCLLALEYILNFPKAMYCDFSLICLFTAYTVFKSLNITCGQLTFFSKCTCFLPEEFLGFGLKSLFWLSVKLHFMYSVPMCLFQKIVGICYPFLLKKIKNILLRLVNSLTVLVGLVTKKKQFWNCEIYM